MEKNYKNELFNMSSLVFQTKFKSTNELNKFLETEKMQYKDKFGNWKFFSKFSTYEKFEEVQVNQAKKVLTRKVTYEGRIAIFKFLEEKGKLKWQKG